MDSVTSAKLGLAEILLKSLIQEIGPNLFAIALNNASCHGEVFKENFAECLDENDYFLNEWFTGIEKLHTAAKKAESEFYYNRDYLLSDIYKVIESLKKNLSNIDLSSEYNVIVSAERDCSEPKKYLKYLHGELKALKKIDDVKKRTTK